MNPLFKILDDKLFWYKKYLACDEAYLMALNHAPDIAIDEIELFYGNRESLLKILESLDEKMQKLVDQKPEKETSAEDRTKIQYYIREKDSIVKRIVELDDEILKSIEMLRVQGAEKIKALGKGKKALAKYKSTSHYNEKIDKRV